MSLPQGIESDSLSPAKEQKSEDKCPPATITHNVVFNIVMGKYDSILINSVVLLQCQNILVRFQAGWAFSTLRNLKLVWEQQGWGGVEAVGTRGGGDCYKDSK